MWVKDSVGRAAFEDGVRVVGSPDRFEMMTQACIDIARILLKTLDAETKRREADGEYVTFVHDWVWAFSSALRSPDLPF